MKQLLLLSIVLLIGFPSPLSAQQKDEVRTVLKSALSYPALSSFWCEDSAGALLLSGIATRNQIRPLEGFSFEGAEVPMTTRFPQNQGHVLELRKLSLNSSRTKARVKFRYHNRVNASIRLHWINGLWRVKGALIRQKQPCEAGDKQTRFVWNF